MTEVVRAAIELSTRTGGARVTIEHPTGADREALEGLCVPASYEREGHDYYGGSWEVRLPEPERRPEPPPAPKRCPSPEGLTGAQLRAVDAETRRLVAGEGPALSRLVAEVLSSVFTCGYDTDRGYATPWEVVVNESERGGIAYGDGAPSPVRFRIARTAPRKVRVLAACDAAFARDWRARVGLPPVKDYL